jgi:hypothetical protein
MRLVATRSFWCATHLRPAPDWIPHLFVCGGSWHSRACARRPRLWVQLAVPSASSARAAPYHALHSDAARPPARPPARAPLSRRVAPRRCRLDTLIGRLSGTLAACSSQKLNISASNLSPKISMSEPPPADVWMTARSDADTQEMCKKPQCIEPLAQSFKLDYQARCRRKHVACMHERR